MNGSLPLREVFKKLRREKLRPKNTTGGGHYEAIATTQPDSVHNLIGMTALVMWPKLPYTVKLDPKVIF